jgi:adenylosuccinate synthase
MISDRAHVVLPWHMAEDQILNQSNVDGENIGTTLRGIGPCYRDKVGRTHAVRLGDMLRADFAQRVGRIADYKNRWLSAQNGSVAISGSEIYRDYAAYAERLRPYVCDTTDYLFDAVEQKKNLLFEGAQGALLDIDHGTYPFVTSSNSSGVGVSAGSGVAGRWIDRVIGVAKTYSTRVGGGPFPTELDNDIGNHIRERGKEFGTTTGRPRRCGWFDAVAVRYTVRLSGVDVLAAMMLDVLSELPEIKICTAYEINGTQTRRFPSQVDDLRQAMPVYETMPGWQQEITAVRRFQDLPENARAYLERVSTLVGCPVGIVSVGPDREQTVIVDPKLGRVRT